MNTLINQLSGVKIGPFSFQTIAKAKYYQNRACKIEDNVVLLQRNSTQHLFSAP
jgi:hypothetical protein